MKRSVIVFIVAALVLVSSGIWFFTSGKDFKSMDLLHFGVILLIIGFALYFGFKRLSSARRGEPAEDELSKRVLQRTAALSYYISLYIWLLLLFIKDRVTLDTEELLGMGILGMAVTFGISWLIINLKGFRND